MRMNASIGFDRRLWRQDVESSRAHAKMLAARGSSPMRTATRSCAGSTRWPRSLRAGTSSSRLRRRHPHGDRAPPDRAGRSVGGKLHTARSRNDQVATDLVMYVRERCAAAREGIAALMRPCWSAPKRTWTGGCRATPICSVLSPSISATICWPTSGCSTATASASPSPSGSVRGCRWGRGAAGVNFDTDRRLVAEELGFEEPAPKLDRRGLKPRLRARLPERRGDVRHAPVAPGRRAGALVKRRVRLLRAAGQLECRVLDHAAEEEPRRRRAAARQGASLVGHLAALHGVMHALPLTYNKDLQEDKEHLFDAGDTLALALAAARG